MKMFKIAFFALFFVGSMGSVSSAERYIQPALYDDQEELYVDGTKCIQSQKDHCVVMTNVSGCTDGRRATFNVVIANRANEPFLFEPAHIRVTNQNGTRLRLFSKKHLIAEAEKEAFWKNFWTGLGGGLSTVSNSLAANPYSSNSVALSQIQNSQVRMETTHQYEKTDSKKDGLVSSLKDSYIDRNTIVPNTVYGGIMQIEIPREIEKQTKYVVFQVDCSGETHTFCFYTGQQKSGFSSLWK